MNTTAIAIRRPVSSLDVMFRFRAMFPTELIEHILSYISLDEVFALVERLNRTMTNDEKYTLVNNLRYAHEQYYFAYNPEKNYQLVLRLEDYQQIASMRTLVKFNYTKIDEFTRSENGVSPDLMCSREIASFGREGYSTEGRLYQLVADEDRVLFQKRHVDMRNLIIGLIFAGFTYTYKTPQSSFYFFRFLMKRTATPDYTPFRVIKYRRW